MTNEGLGNQSRITHQHRHAPTFFVKRTFVAEAVFTEVKTVVADEYDHGVGRDVQLIKPIENPAHVGIYGRDAAMIIAFGRFTVGDNVCPIGRGNT